MKKNLKKKLLKVQYILIYVNKYHCLKYVLKIFQMLIYILLLKMKEIVKCYYHIIDQNKIKK